MQCSSICNQQEYSSSNNTFTQSFSGVKYIMRSFLYKNRSAIGVRTYILQYNVIIREVNVRERKLVSLWLGNAHNVVAQNRVIKFKSSPLQHADSLESNLLSTGLPFRYE